MSIIPASWKFPSWKNKDSLVDTKIKLLFVCMGNICRSPLAEGVFLHHAEQANIINQIETDSAGTHAYHIGEPPDPRSQSIATEHQIDISKQRARKVTEHDFEYFDYILAMDQDNFDILIDACPEAFRHRIHLILSFAPQIDHQDVPDPYYGGSFGFERVFDLVTDASIGLLETLDENQGRNKTEINSLPETPAQ
ncbi:MAG: low molecular weight protein-tyrosine-phosphatase [Methylococcales bacterium]